MSKLNQKIVLFIEPAVKAWKTPSNIGNLFMNRFAIDEDVKHEILKIYHLENNLDDRLSSEKGLDLINYTIISCDCYDRKFLVYAVVNITLVKKRCLR